MTPFSAMPRMFTLTISEPEVRSVVAFLTEGFRPPILPVLKEHQDRAVAVFARLNAVLEQVEEG